MTAVELLRSLVDQPDPFRNPPENLREIQLEAVRERFEERRGQIKVLDRRARESGVGEIRTLADAVPLMLPDSTFKSYPEAFVDQKRWDRLTLWLQTISSLPITGLDYSRIGNIDDWVDELHRNGHYVVTSSGTSGKQSFINQTAGDRDLATLLTIRTMQWATRFDPERRYALFQTFPEKGAHVASFRSANFGAAIGAPGDVHPLSNVSNSADSMMRLTRLKRAVADGTASPSEITAFRAENEARQQQIGEDVKLFVDTLLSRRKDAMVIAGFLPMLLSIVEEGRRRGIPDGDFHPDTIISTGGGIKNAVVPADIREQVIAFYGVGESGFIDTYGFSETSGAAPRTAASNGYAIPPWFVPIVLDKSGETLLNPEDGKGVVEGRMAMFDPLVEGRWGGVISGDKVTVDFSPGEDGIKVPIVRSIARYRDLAEGDDKLTCAGTVDSYVRGLIEA